MVPVLDVLVQKEFRPKRSIACLEYIDIYISKSLTSPRLFLSTRFSLFVRQHLRKRDAAKPPHLFTACATSSHPPLPYEMHGRTI